jgi:tungstate transport system substrate-binding protein
MSVLLQNDSKPRKLLVAEISIVKYAKITFFPLILVVLLAACGQATPENRRLVLATTTSTYDSGLLDAIIPDFEAQSGYQVDIIAVGTGQAIALGEAGDADVLLVHARSREDAFIEAGFGTARYDVMVNDFVILGAEDDPANIAGGNDAAAAFIAIAEVEVNFISRGDDSGTHTKERAIWAAANIEPEGDWYQEAGQSMGAILTIANEQQAYTLSDRGTYIARSAEGLDLVVLLEGDPVLANPYGVIPVNPEKKPSVNFEGAQAFVTWLTSLETQEAIATYQVDGQQLFFPDSSAYHEAQN